MVHATIELPLCQNARHDQLLKGAGFVRCPEGLFVFSLQWADSTGGYQMTVAQVLTASLINATAVFKDAVGNLAGSTIATSDILSPWAQRHLKPGAVVVSQSYKDWCQERKHKRRVAAFTAARQKRDEELVEQGKSKGLTQGSSHSVANAPSNSTQGSNNAPVLPKRQRRLY